MVPFQYMLDFVNDKRKMVFYYQRIKAKYIQYHEVFEQDGKFGLQAHQGNIMPVSYTHLDVYKRQPIYIIGGDRNSMNGPTLPRDGMAPTAENRSVKFSSEIRQPAEKDGKNPKRLFFGKRDVPS